MARRNGIWYDGTVINNTGQTALKKAKNGRLVLEVLVAERFQEKNSKAPADKQDPAKGPDDYVTVQTAWHRVQVFDTAEGDPAFRALVTDARFNHGALITVDAGYTEEQPWTDKQNQVRVGRREKIFFGGEDGGYIGLKPINDRVYGASDGHQVALWDGTSEVPAMGGSGTGARAPEYSADEGF
jgi:hypothetical protein